MSIHFGGKKVKEMYWAGRKVKEAWYEGQKVYSAFTLPPGNFRGEFQLGVLYRVGDLVKVSNQGANDGIYQATMEHTSSAYDYPWNSARRWEKVVDSSGALIKPVEVMPAMTRSYDAQKWLRTKLTEYGENYKTVKEIPFAIDAGEATGLEFMFSECSSLTTAPWMDTSNATAMRAMFRGCSSLTAVPDMRTAQVTDTAYMFYNCEKLTDGNVRLIGKHPQADTKLMIGGSGLTREPFYDSNGRPI